MQIFFGIIIFGLILLAIIVMVVINFMYKNIRRLREEAEERYYRNLKHKEQKEKNPFGEDYFKSSTKKQNNRGQQSQYSTNQTGNSQERTTARRMTTDDGVTIIDDRGEDKQKIFTHDDGEYVEFEEVH